MGRFTAVKQYFRNSMKRLPGGELRQTVKGLAFVQVYAIYEYTVREVTRIAISQIAAHAHGYSELRFSILAVFLDPQLRSLRDCGDKDAWNRRFELFKRAASDEPIDAVQGIIPHDGTHFKHTQTELILKILGINRALTIRKRHLYVIDDVVEKRNSITHGDETAVEVGRNSGPEEIRNMIRIMENTCLRLIALAEEHCRTPHRHLR